MLNEKINCIERFISLQGKDAIVSFLQEEKIIDVTDLYDCKTNKDIATKLYLSIKHASQSDKLSLVYFEWIILPKELIKITLVTSKTHREFYHLSV